jgi:LPS sulfotransferase NodH
MSISHETGNNFVFIVGCQRSGTSWVQELLASHPQVHSGQESFLFARYLGPEIRAWLGELDATAHGGGGDGLQCYFTNEKFRAILRVYTESLLQPMAESLKAGEIFVEKTPDHSLYMPEILELLPESRFIHVLRDPRDVASSMIAASKTWASGWAPKTGRQAARWWMKRVLAVREASKKLNSKQFMEIKYENMRASPNESMSKLLDFLGLSWGKDDIDNAIRKNDPSSTSETGTRISVGGEFAKRSGETIVKHSQGFIRKASPGAWKQDLTLRQKVGIWRVARKTMESFGYPWKYPW